MKTCIECGRPLPGATKAKRCPACREKHEKAERQRRKEESRGTFCCIHCGGKFEAYGWPHHPTCCPDCRKKARQLGQRKRWDMIHAAKEEKPKAKPVQQGEPAGNPNSLAHVCWELDNLNRERRAAGKEPLSYGKYVQGREEIPWKKKK